MSKPSPAPAFVRLGNLAALDAEAIAALEQALARPRFHRARREIVAAGEEITETLLIARGWAARVELLEDGRRQIINFLLPGDLIGLCDQDQPVASSTVVAVTDVDLCIAPDAAGLPSLRRAYAVSRARDEAYLLAQITRLGRLNAYERIADFLLELLDRLELAGLATKGRLEIPVTQEMLADALGLTSVHVNRTLQVLRREGSVTWEGRSLVVTDPAALRRRVGRQSVRVSAAG